MNKASKADQIAREAINALIQYKPEFKSMLLESEEVELFIKTTEGKELVVVIKKEALRQILEK